MLTRTLAHSIVLSTAATLGYMAPAHAAAPSPPQGTQPSPSAAVLAGFEPTRVRALYDGWKQHYLKTAPCRADEMYVQTTGDAGQAHDITVSEAHGYGMLLLAAMGSRDTSAQADFDRMVRLMMRMNAAPNVALMTWRLDEKCLSDAAETSAPDGDLDMAYALLVADKAWGSGQTFNYRTLAIERINAIMEHIVVGAGGPTPHLGLWERERMDPQSDRARGSRLSDFMPGHFRAFYDATQDARWLRVIDFGYATMAALQADNGTGLLPDFVVFEGEGHLQAKPAPAGFLEGERDGSYGYNACRIPWRLGADSAPDARAHKVALGLARGLLKVSHGRPAALVDAYTLTGEPMGTAHDKLAFLAPAAFLLHALEETRPSSAPWAQHVRRLRGAEQKYYNDTLRVLTAVQALVH